MKYNPNEIEAKWAKYWAENAAQNAPKTTSDKTKYYALTCFIHLELDCT
jgi:leucyl-tRNA synthetase